MAHKKTGRPPSENPLVDRIFIRVNEETKAQLDECVKTLNTTRSEIVRKGIALVHEGLKK
jgi:hypothetical protein